MPSINSQANSLNKTQRVVSEERWSLIPKGDRIFVQAIRKETAASGVQFTVKHGWSASEELRAIIRRVKADEHIATVLAGVDSDDNAHAAVISALHPITGTKKFGLVSFIDLRTTAELLACAGEFADESVDFSTARYEIATFH